MAQIHEFKSQGRGFLVITSQSAGGANDIIGRWISIRGLPRHPTAEPHLGLAIAMVPI